MQVIIAGSREIRWLSPVVRAIRESGFRVTTVVTGGARGVDKFAEKWAKHNGINLVVIEANWTKYGLSAGMVRNKQMVDLLVGAPSPAGLIAVWDGVSTGTKDIIDYAKSKMLQVYVHRVYVEDFEFLETIAGDLRDY